MNFLLPLKAMVNPWTLLLIVCLSFAGLSYYTKTLIEQNAVAKGTIDTMIEANKRKTKRLEEERKKVQTYEANREKNRLDFANAKTALLKDEAQLKSRPIEEVLEYVKNQNALIVNEIACVSGDTSKCTVQ